MFAFRNRSSPTVSQLLRFSRSPVHLSIHYHAGPGPIGLPIPDQARRAAADVVFALMQDVLDQRTPAASTRAALPPPPSRPHVAALVLGAASVLLAASALAARNGGARQLSLTPPPAALPAPAPASG